MVKLYIISGLLTQSYAPVLLSLRIKRLLFIHYAVQVPRSVSQFKLGSSPRGDDSPQSVPLSSIASLSHLRTFYND